MSINTEIRQAMRKVESVHVQLSQIFPLGDEGRNEYVGKLERAYKLLSEIQDVFE